MRVIRGREIVEDAWQFVDDGEVLAEGDVIVSYRRWRDESDTLSARKGELAIWVDGDDDILEVSQYLGRFPLIAVRFPVFTDGRSFTVARQLRERYGYRGELRAVGDVARDQLQFMARCGIDCFALRQGDDFDAALQAFAEFTAVYQPAADQAVPISRSRHNTEGCG